MWSVNREGEHSKRSWIAFGVIMAMGLINAFCVFMGRDGALASIRCLHQDN